MADLAIDSKANEEQERILERILEFAASVERPDLVERGEEIVQAEKRHYARVDEPAGYEMVAAQLRRDEDALKAEIQRKETEWSEQESTLRQRQANEIMDMVLSKWGVSDLFAGIESAEIKSDPAKVRETLLRAKREGEENKASLTSAIRTLMERVKVMSELMDDATGALRGYQRARLLRTWLPKGLALLISLLAFALGATLVGDTIQEQGLKIGFVLGIWALQELWFVPFSEKKLSHYERESLKHSIRSFYKAKLLFVLQSSIIDHEFASERERAEGEPGVEDGGHSGSTNTPE
jgi:hypothetical protein